MLDSWAMISELLRPARIVSSSSSATPAIAQSLDLIEHHIESLLGPVGRSPGVAQHGRSFELAFIRGIDRVA